MKDRIQFQQLPLTALQLEAPDNEKKISSKLLEDLQESIDRLPSHPKHKTAIRSALKEKVLEWQNNSGIARSLVITSSPVVPLTKIIYESLNGDKKNVHSQINTRDEDARTHDYDRIKKQLISQIESLDKQKRQLIIIPQLESCFLRCIGGLEVVETLREIIYEYPSLFWLIGCNSWAWKYLDCIYEVSRYLDDIMPLPPLNGEEMREWLQPVIDEIDIDWEEKPENENWNNSREKYLYKTQGWWQKLKIKASSNWQEEKEEETDTPQQKYFRNLAKFSSGIGTVGARLWLESLQSPVSEEDGNQSDRNQMSELQITKAKLPNLPSLNADDRYVIYSLLLHGRMSLPHLASSLGQSENEIKTRLPFLLQSGVVMRDRNMLSIEPAHYINLKATLSNHNFIVGEDL